MKTQKEIEQLAKAQYSYDYGEDTSITDMRRNGFEDGYTQCQQDTAAKFTQLKEAIKKHTWYDEDGFPQVNLHGIEHLLVD
jgi:hypothetical protein